MRGRELWRWPHPHSSSFTLRYCLKSLFGALWVSLLFEPRDLWVGIYWTRPDVAWHRAVDIYVYVLPVLPVKLSWRRQSPEQLKSNFSHYVRETRYRLECAIYGEDVVAHRWFDGIPE